MIELSDRRDTRLSAAVLLCAVGLFFAPVGVAGCRAFGAETSSAVRAHGLPLVVTIQGRETPIVADAGRSESVRIRFSGGDLTAAGRSAIDAFAKRSAGREAARVLVIGGVASGEDVSAAYRRARVVRERLVAAGWNGDRLVVAGWRTVGTLPIALGQLDRSDEFVVVPLVEKVRTVSAVEGDPGRALALDSAYSRLAVVSEASSSAKAAATEVPPPVIAAARAPISHPAPSPAEKPADPIARIIATDLPTPRPVSPAGPGVPPSAVATAAVRPAVNPALGAPAGRNGCGAPAIVMDDFYPGGPFRDCAGRPRVITR